MTKLLHPDLTYYLRGIGFKIRNELGGSHSEQIYEDALAWQLETDEVRFKRQPAYRVVYKGKQVGEYRPDIMLADDQVALELKAVPTLKAIHKAQGISYLAVTNAELSLLMNFGANAMEFERLPNFLYNRKPLETRCKPPENILYPEITKSLLRGLFEIHHTLGPGFLHQIYRRAALHELPQQGLGVEYIKALPIRYQGVALQTSETRLLMVEKKVLLATVAMKQISSRHSERLRWAMRELGCQLGLLTNFYPSQLDVHFLRR